MRGSARRGRFTSLSVVMVVLGLSAFARAEQPRNVDIPRFDPAPAGDPFFGVPSPETPGQHELRLGVLLDYAHDPLVLTGSDGGNLGHVVANQMLLHVGAALNLFGRLQLNADLPFAVVNSGDGTIQVAPYTGANAFVSPAGAGLGDLRLGARVRLFGASTAPFQLAVGADVWIPTARRDSFLTDTKARVRPHLLLGGLADRFLWSVLLGTTLRSSQSFGGEAVGSQFVWGAAAGVRLGERRLVQLDVESTGGVTLRSGAQHRLDTEALAGVKVRVLSPLLLGVAAGRGMALGLGTPDFRGVFSVAYAPVVDEDANQDRDGDGVADRADACPLVPGIAQRDPHLNGCPPPDRDGDGIPDNRDACPDQPGPRRADANRNGCPSRDADNDGILDEADACPTQAGPPSDDPRKNGCPPPPDQDGDGVADADDACPATAGLKTADPATSGCPGDTDGDGFRDDQDACPKEKGVDDPDPAKRGCPRAVRVTEGEIVILEQVQFDTNKATVKPTSEELLSSVAQVMKDHPEITRVEVQGHTDNRGARKRNAKLSQARAEAVMAFLTARGIAPGRLVAKGYGQDKPLAPNDSDENRQKNRRVQFVILEKAPPAAGGGEAPPPAETPATGSQPAGANP